MDEQTKQLVAAQLTAAYYSTSSKKMGELVAPGKHLAPKDVVETYRSILSELPGPDTPPPAESGD